MTGRVRRSILLAAGFAAGIMLGMAQAAASGDPIPRVEAQQMTLQEMQALPAVSRVVVKLREGRSVRLAGGRLSGLSSSEAASFDATLQAAGVDPAGMRRMFTQPAARLDAERADAEAKSGRELADLNLYFTLDLPEGVSAAEVADRLNRLDMVEFAQPAPVPAPPPVDISPPTPDFSGQQGYKGSAPTGIDLPEADLFPGVDGADMAFADVEYSWQLDHEDLELPADRNLIADGVDPFPSTGTNHGTAVLGEIVGGENAYGVTGIAPAAMAYVAAASTTGGYNPANAINAATAQLNAGDVIVIEQQYWACGPVGSPTTFGPLEWLQPVFDATSIATAAGIVVVAAAGNGNVDLDGANCNGLFDRSVRDSGAIIVGAGSSANRSKLGFSSHGSRVDVQGWGQSVTTTGYGALFNGGGDVRQRYTSGFNGTSSATPIVAGAVLALQGRRKACLMDVATPAEVRQVLAATGSPQSNPGSGNIGPLPNVTAALDTMGLLDCGPEPVDVDPSLFVTPVAAYQPKGRAGGPFKPGKQFFTLSNTGGGSLSWSAKKSKKWVRALPEGGSLDAGQSVVVTVDLERRRANKLRSRKRPYKANVTFTNLNNGMGDTSRRIKLRVKKKKKRGRSRSGVSG